jgi:diguanylate cyclase (GGDEF)-like protein
MSGVAIERLIAEPKSFIYIWANVVSLWMVSYLAAVLAEEAERARRSVEEAKEKVETFSNVDWLTGLFNMKYFDYQAAQELARSERYERPLSLLMLDSDNLKVVNDTYGHQWGDKLITGIAQLAVQHSRLSDTVVRYGGDEFLILLPETDPVGARFMAERIRAAIEERGLRVDSRSVKTTVSIGLASFPKDASDVMGLVARADAALYQSKQAGRNRVTTFTEGMMAEEAATPPGGEQGSRTVAT